MKANNVKIGGGGGLGNFLFAGFKRCSPFGFGTLKEIPLPTWSLVFAILFFCLMWRGYDRNFDFVARNLNASVACFTYRIRVEKEPLPEVLILGNSLNAMGLDRAIIAEKLKKPVHKAAIGGCWLWEAERILKKYRAETKNVKLVLINLRAVQLSSDPAVGPAFLSGNSFHALKDVTDLSIKNLLFLYKLKDNKKVRKNKNSFLLPLKCSIRTMRDRIRAVPIDDHESLWTDFTIWAKGRREAVLNKIGERTSPPESHIKRYSNEMEDDLWDFVAYCQSRNIFVVFNITPQWYLLPAHKPEGEKLTEADHRFLALCMALERHPNCSVIYLRDFRKIDPDMKCEEMFFDVTGHMTGQGATVYSNWLADQIQHDRKIVAALKTPRKREDFFVKKYVKETWRTVAGYFKTTPAKSEEPAQVAAPPKATQIR